MEGNLLCKNERIGTSQMRCDPKFIKLELRGCSSVVISITDFFNLVFACKDKRLKWVEGKPLS